MNKSKYLLRTLEELAPGDHLCCLYQTEEEHRAMLTPFLRNGLERNEKVIYIGDVRTANVIEGYLRDDGLYVKDYFERGQLKILGAGDAYTKSGVFDPEGMIALLQKETARAVAEGYSALRVTGEMTWALRGVPGSDRLMEYEAKLNRFFPFNKCSAVCQYDMRQFGPGILVDVLSTHPVAIVGTEVFDNFYYTPPGDFLGPNGEEVRLQSRLTNLRERKRAEEALQKAHDELERRVEERTSELLIANQRLKSSEEELRHLSSRLLSAQEEERKRVAREIHDTIGQSLNAIKFTVENFLQEGEAEEVYRGKKSLSSVIPMVQGAVEELRRIERNLRPSMLDDLGLLTTITWYCREFEKTYSRIRVKKQLDIDEGDVPDRLKIVIFRILQESLNNISKHSQASQIHLQLQKTNEKLQMSVNDNGVGFDSENMLSRHGSEGGVGLANMKERTELSGGSFLVETSEGTGTTIRVSWELQ